MLKCGSLSLPLSASQIQFSGASSSSKGNPDAFTGAERSKTEASLFCQEIVVTWWSIETGTLGHTHQKEGEWCNGGAIAGSRTQKRPSHCGECQLYKCWTWAALMELSYAGRLNVSIMPRVHQGMENRSLTWDRRNDQNSLLWKEYLSITYLIPSTCVYIRKYYVHTSIHSYVHMYITYVHMYIRRYRYKNKHV